MERPKSRTVPDLLDEIAERYPERDALVGGDQRYSWATLRTRVRELAKGLHALGVRRGDTVAILMGNRAEWVIADLAILMLGGTMVAANTWATARELAYQLRHAACRVLITQSALRTRDYVQLLAEIREAGDALPEHVFCVGDTPPDGMRAFDELWAMGGAVADAEIDAAQARVAPEDVAYLLYTSGSTALPKGVPVQHYGLVENTWNIGERLGVTEQDRLWLAVSLFWGLGCENALLALMTHGGCIVLQESFDAGEALALIESERCTVFYGTPNMTLALQEHPDLGSRDISSMRKGATIGSPEQMLRLVDLGVTDICQIYGLTETYANCSVNDARDPLERRITSVGRPLPGFDIAIVDGETGARLPAGEVGEIRVRGYVATGYHKEPEKTAEVFDADGFFRTGDLGYIDADGYLYFRGRLKEMIKTGGINVSPAEVEDVLLAHEAVELAYVIGVPDARRDETVAAVIVPRGEADAETLRAHCRRTLAAYKVPQAFRFVAQAELPLTTTGKLQKNRLADFFRD